MTIHSSIIENHWISTTIIIFIINFNASLCLLFREIVPSGISAGSLDRRRRPADQRSSPPPFVDSSSLRFGQLKLWILTSKIDKKITEKQIHQPPKETSNFKLNDGRFSLAAINTLGHWSKMILHLFNIWVKVTGKTKVTGHILIDFSAHSAPSDSICFSLL